MRMEKGHVENRKEKLEEIDLQQWEKRVSWFHGVVGIIWVQSVHIRQQSLTQSLTGEEEEEEAGERRKKKRKVCEYNLVLAKYAVQ
ncbi:hypothetical protein VIGAN_06183300 [Vigna angularis var. angularis]|uniref:Uncharacterized protein n=1 Tax=Vigna angularis var. angularis TaxID=157739 RepID=A0A0S3SCG4_PHAAN|nr:hypothetical protein VIGAN_06183300 [Vigna angularis var. angularis]